MSKNHDAVQERTNEVHLVVKGAVDPEGSTESWHVNQAHIHTQRAGSVATQLLVYTVNSEPSNPSALWSDQNSIAYYPYLPNLCRLCIPPEAVSVAGSIHFNIALVVCVRETQGQGGSLMVEVRDTSC